MSLGCCGRPVSIAGLAELADMYPPRSPQGRRARARLAYTIVAAKAAQAGNRQAYERAMHGLRGLRDVPTTPVSATSIGNLQQTLVALGAPGGRVQSLINTVGDVRAILGLVGTLIDAIASATNDQGIEQGALWFNWFLQGMQGVPPTMDAGVFNTFADFCQGTDWIGVISGARPPANAGEQLAMQAYTQTSAALAHANAQFATVASAVFSFFTVFRNALCSDPEMQGYLCTRAGGTWDGTHCTGATPGGTTLPSGASVCAASGAVGPNWVLTAPTDGTPPQCVCAAGYIAMADHTCQPTSPAAEAAYCAATAGAVGPHWMRIPGPDGIPTSQCGCAPGYTAQPNHTCLQNLTARGVPAVTHPILRPPTGAGVRCPDGSIASSAAACPGASSGPSAAVVVGIPAAAFLAWKLFF